MRVSMWGECFCEQRDHSTYKHSEEGFRGLAIALVLPYIVLMAIATSSANPLKDADVSHFTEKTGKRIYFPKIRSKIY